MKTFFKALGAAALSGATSAFVSSVADPLHFNVGDWQHLAVVGAAGALTGVAGYLTKSPLGGEPK